MKQVTIKTIKSIFRKTISKTMNYSGIKKVNKLKGVFKNEQKKESTSTVISE